MPCLVRSPPGPEGPIGLTEARFGDATDESRSYDKRERLQSTSTVNGSQQTIYREGLTYDLAGNVKTANDLVNGNWTYTYDFLNRLSTAVASTTGPNAGEGCQYSYDPFGNRTQESAFQGTCFSPAPFTFSGNRINGYCYDSAGNLLDLGPCPSGNHQFFYDGYGNLASPNFNASNRNSYTVDGLGQRVAKWQGGSIIRQYLYGADGSPVAEMDGAGNWQQTNVRAGGFFLAELQSSGATYLHSDHLGTIRVQTGSQPMTCTNLPFAEALTCNGGTNPPGYHFTGKERDSESGNDYFESRYYASAMGRFLSPDDPFVGQHENDPQSWNLYTYARNNPLTNIDPDGHDCVNGSNAANGTVSYINTSNPADCGKGFTYVNGTVDPNSFTYKNGQLGFNISNYADGSGIAGSVTMTVGNRADPDTLKAGVFGPASAQTWRNANGVVTAAGTAELTVASIVMPEILLEDTEILSLGLSKTAAQSLEKLAGLGRAEARAALEKAGFKQRGVTKGGYENWVHPDGSRVSIGPDGGVDRIPPPSVGKGFRYDSETGNIRRPHNVPDEKVE